MYLLFVDKNTMAITSISNVLKTIDVKYDILKTHYSSYAIENIVPAFIYKEDSSFDLAFSALIALLLIVLIVLFFIITVCCCCKKAMFLPNEEIKKGTLINDDQYMTENPLWIEQ